jgi:hypothetical protein
LALPSEGHSDKLSLRCDFSRYRKVLNSKKTRRQIRTRPSRGFRTILEQQNFLRSSRLYDQDPAANKKMRRVRVRLRLQESGGAKLDHDADSACSDRRFELYNSLAFFLCCDFSERCCLFFFAFLSAAILASVAVFSFLLFALCSLLSFCSGLL